MTDTPASAIAYTGANHTRRAAKAALAALLSSHDFGGRADVRAAYAPDSADWPGVKAAPLVLGVKIDNPIDERWDGETTIETRLAVLSEKLSGEAYLGGTGAEVFPAFVIDWSVVTSGTLTDWCAPVFDHVLSQIGAILTAAQRNPDPAFLDLSVGEVELMQFDLGDRAALSASIPVDLILDAQTLFA